MYNILSLGSIYLCEIYTRLLNIVLQYYHHRLSYGPSITTHQHLELCIFLCRKQYCNALFGISSKEYSTYARNSTHVSRTTAKILVLPTHRFINLVNNDLRIYWLQLNICIAVIPVSSLCYLKIRKPFNQRPTACFLKWTTFNRTSGWGVPKWTSLNRSGVTRW